MKKLVVLMIAMLGLAGCPGKSGSTNNPNGVNGLVQAGTSCPLAAANFSQQLTAAIPQGILTLNLAGDPSQMNAWGMNQIDPAFAYQGPACVYGTLSTNTSLPLGMCQLPAGTYNVRTLQVGQYSAGTFNIPMVELDGPAHVLVSLSQGVVLTSGTQAITGFGALLLGQQGPSAISGFYPMYNQAYANCGDSIGIRFQ
jgi:hypothetical protein